MVQGTRHLTVHSTTDCFLNEHGGNNHFRVWLFCGVAANSGGICLVLLDPDFVEDQVFDGLLANGPEGFAVSALSK